jgi:hypothetical protein
MMDQQQNMGVMAHFEKMCNKAVEYVGEKINDCIMALGSFLDKLTENVKAMGGSGGLNLGGIGSKLNPTNWFRQNSSPDPTPSQGQKVGRSAEVMRQMETPTREKPSVSLPGRVTQIADMAKASGFGFSVTDASTGQAVSPSTGMGSWNRFNAQQAGVGI